MSQAHEVSDSAPMFMERYIDNIHAAFGERGIVALAWWFGSLFAEEIRAAHGSYPLLEIAGEPGSGKTCLVESLWKLLGREDYEGFDPTMSTGMAFGNHLNDVRNRPVVMIGHEDIAHIPEGRRMQLKASYNGTAMYIGNRSAGSTGERFRGALLHASLVSTTDETLRLRMVQITLDRRFHTEASREAALRLQQAKASDVAQLEHAATNRYLTLFASTEQHLRRLQSILGHGGDRTALNHAQVMALVDALNTIGLITAATGSATKEAIVRMAVASHFRSSAKVAQ